MTRRAPFTEPEAQRAAIVMPPVRGLRREAAAAYVGVGTSKFDELVKDGRMPQPKQIDGRRVWDVRALDDHFEALPSVSEPNPWDDK